MATLVRMPEVLANTGEASIQTWLVTVGQEIAIGDPIAEIETEKAVVEYAAEVAGVLAQLIAEPGATIAVGEPIAVVIAQGEAVADIAPRLFVDTTRRDADVGAPVPEQATVPTTRIDGRRLFATPLVRKIAQERGVDLSAVIGTGPGGRVVRRDIDGLATPERRASPDSATVPEDKTSEPDRLADIPLTGMRKAIARRLTESKTTVPHFYMGADCRVDALLELRRTINESAAVKVSVNDFVLKAVAGALMEIPEANCIWNGDSIRRFGTADVAVAVAVDSGLLTPVLRGVDRLSISDVSAQVGDLADRARAGRIKQHELEGGTFSVSNLGMFGVSEFSAILNPPHSGILAVGAAKQKPLVVNNELTIGSIMTVTLSADHRVVDGAIAAKWMEAFVRRIEHPLTILI